MKMENKFFEKGEQKKQSIFEKIRSKVGRSLRTLLMASILFSPLQATEGKSISIGDKDNKPDTELPVDMNNNQGSEFFDMEKSDIEKDKNFEKVGLSPTFIQTNPETGQKEFNFMSIIAPFDFTVSTVENREYTTTFTVPYEYARLFSEDPNASKETNSEDYGKLSEYVKTELQTELKNAFYGFGFSENVYNANHPGELEDQSIKVEYMRVIGMTSPEGHVNKGKESIIPGNIDEDNIELGHTRASAAEKMTIEELKNLGVNTDEIESFLHEQGSVENQCSEEEMQRLAELAQDYEGVDDIEKIFKLYQDYNQGKIQDQSVVNELDKIIGSKRCVQIEIGLQGQRRIVVAVPIPLLLLLPLAWRFFPKKRKETQDEKSKPKEGPKPEPNSDKQKEQVIEKEPDKGFNILNPNQVPERVIKTELPDNPEEYKYMESETIEDLYIGFDNPDNIKLGIDYRGIFDYYYKHYDGFKDANDLETAIAYKILMSWKAHDIANRKSAGLSNPEEGMDYENNEKQIQWSKMHARKLIEMIEKMKENEFKNGAEEHHPELENTGIDILKSKLSKLTDNQIIDVRKFLEVKNRVEDQGREDNESFIINFVTKIAPSLLENTNTYITNILGIKEIKPEKSENSKKKQEINKEKKNKEPKEDPLEYLTLEYRAARKKKMEEMFK